MKELTIIATMYREILEDDKFRFFVDITATSIIIVYQCNDSLVNPRNLIREIYHWG